MKYTNVFEVLADCDLYMAVRKGVNLNLSQLQSLARNRWQWIVDNWQLSLYERFKLAAMGDDTMEQTLEDMNSNVISWNLGNKRNPLELFENFISFGPYLELIPLSQLSLTTDERIFVAKETERVSNFVIEDFRAMVDFLQQEFSLDAFRIGLGDADGARQSGVLPIPKQKTATIFDLDRLSDGYDIIDFIEGIIIDLKNTTDKPPNLLDIANNNLDPSSGVKVIDAYRSAIAVPFEISLEHMAKKYMGSQDLFFELVTVNKLQPPYIDEVGEKLSLLAPGALNSVIVPGSRKDDMPVGTKIKIGSAKVREEARIIEKIQENTDGSLVIFLSGAQDLSKFKSSELSFIRVYKPHTVNSGSMILIPSVAEGGELSKYTPKTDELRRLSSALLNFGVDILRDEKTGGLVCDSNGNFAYAAGMKNVRQAVLYALKTTQGELPFHPEFGVTTNIGGRYYGTIDEAVLFANTLRQSLLTDQRFDDIQVLGLNPTNTGISLSFLVKIKGLNAPIPLSFVS